MKLALSKAGRHSNIVEYTEPLAGVGKSMMRASRHGATPNSIAEAVACSSHSRAKARQRPEHVGLTIHQTLQQPKSLKPKPYITP